MAKLTQWTDPHTPRESELRETVRWSQRLVRQFERSQLGREIEAGQKKVELPFLVHLPAPTADKVLLRGTIDLLLKNNGSGWRLVEYKGSDVTAFEVPRLLEHHAWQVRMYALALAQLGVQVTEGLIAYLVPNMMCEVDLGPPRQAETQQLWAEFLLARRHLNLPARPGRACAICPWGNQCPEYRAPARSSLVIA